MVQLSRRAAITAGVATTAAAVGAVGVGVGQRLLGSDRRDLTIPDVPAGEHGVERLRSDARGREVDLFTAVPHGYGDGAGLPVCLVLHGADSGRPADYADLGYPQLLTAAVRDGAAPFVLAGADGGAQRWEAVGDDDPGRMVTDEMPEWLRERGFDVARPALWGWSMGGYGVLRIAERRPDWPAAVVAFSPAVGPGDAVFADAERLADVPLGVWCGTEDPLLPAVRDLVAALPVPPEVASYSEGAHNHEFWTSVAEDAFAFLGQHLGGVLPSQPG